jgi:polysaccharide export outer membrane protein
MKTFFRSIGSHLGSPCRLAFLGLVLASLLAGGCATPNDSSEQPPTGQIGENPPGTNAPSHSEVVILREGDVLKIASPSSPNIDTTLPIGRDGKISLQMVGEVQASGYTVAELQDTLVKLYAPQIGSKDVTVALESSSFPVFVTGAVIRPGKVLSDHPMTALEAIMESGGFDYASANTRGVRIIRNENGVMKHFTINLQRVLDGQDSTPFYLQTDDIIYVPERFQLF